MIQSLKAIDGLEGFFGGYGLVVVDECHHLPAVSFEMSVRRAAVRHFLGLTATPYRRDGLQEIVTMQCGPIRHRIASSEGPAGDLALDLVVRETEFAIAGSGETPIQEVFRILVESEARTALVCDDVIEALHEGRRCLVLSNWKEHCHLLADGLRSRGVSPVVLEGSLGKRARTAIMRQIEYSSSAEPLVVVATGQYLGEGFDCPQLDTLFLAFPVSFKRSARPIHRPNHARRRRQDSSPGLRLRRHPCAGAAGDAHTPPHELQEPRVHTRETARRRLPLPAFRFCTEFVAATVDLPEDALAGLQAEATRPGVSIDLVIAELTTSRPAEHSPARSTHAFIGLDSSNSGSARDADELPGEASAGPEPVGFNNNSHRSDRDARHLPGAAAPTSAN